MANYANLLATIAANIYTNGNQEVTAAMVKTVMDAAVNSLGAGYQFMGVAHPSDTPSGYADLRAFWLASEAGTYTNFGGLVLDDGEVAVIKYDGNSFSKDSTGAASLKIVEVIDKLGTASGVSRTIDLSQLQAYDRIISSSNAWTTPAVPDCYSKFVSVSPGKYTITASATTQSIIGFLSAMPVNGQTVSYGTINGVAETSRITIPAGTTKEFTILDSDTSIYLCVRDDVSVVLKPTIVYEANVELYVPLKSEFDPVALKVDILEENVEKIESKIFSFNDSFEDGYTLRKGWMSSDGVVAQFDMAYHIVIPIEPGQYIEVNSNPSPQTSIIAFLSDYVEPTADGQSYNIIGSRYTGTSKLISPEGVKFLFVGIITDNTISHIPESLYINETNIISSISNLFFGIEKNIRELDIERNEFVIDSSLLFNGYWSGLSIISSLIRVGNRVAFPVKRGDIIQQNAYGTYLYKPTVKDAGGNVLEDYRPRYFRTIIQNDGLLYFYIRNIADNTGITLDEVDGLISIYRSGNASFPQKGVIIPDMTDFVHGYINSSYEIAAHSTHYVNYRWVSAQKGDWVVPINNCQIVVHEYSLSGAHLVSSGHYYTGVPTNGMECGKYIVQNNNCMIMCQCAGMTTSPAFLIIHNPSSYNIIASGAYPFTPSSAKKPYQVPMDINYSRYLQNGTFVGDKLYIQYDDYNGNKKILVVNITDGQVEKEMPFTWNKHGGMAYNRNNDILLVSDGGSLMFFHPSEMSGTLTSESAFLTIETEYTYGVIAWGEDDQTIYWCRAYDGNTPSTAESVTIDKIILGITSGNYNGEYTIEETFVGSIDEAINGVYDYAPSNQRFAQDIDYDGYIYLAFGTHGQNFLVLDLIPNSGTFRVVGNYYWKYFTTDRTQKYLEPECVAINGDKLLCASRLYDESLAAVLIFDRTV